MAFIIPTITEGATLEIYGQIDPGVMLSKTTVAIKRKQS